MPDTPIERGEPHPYPGSMEAGVQTLERVATETRAILERMDQRMTAMENRLDRIDTRLDIIERRLDLMDKRMDRLEERVGRLEHRVEVVDTSHRSDFRWMMGTMLGGFGIMLGGFGTILGVMAHGFHWL